MIDSVLVSLVQKRDNWDDGYEPKNAIKSVNLINPEADNLIVIFPPWHIGRSKVLNILSKRLSAHHAVLIFEFNKQILEPNPNRVVESFKFAETKIIKELNKLKQNYKTTHFIGLSTGNIALAAVSAKFSDYSSATLVLAGSNLACCTWESIRTSNIKEELLVQGYDKDKLNKIWHNLAPKTHSTAFKNKKVVTVISKTDKVIPSWYQQEFAEELLKVGANLTVFKTRLGHYAAIADYCLRRGTI